MPLYKLINYIPKTFNSGSIYENVAGGIAEKIVQLSYDETIEYHNKYYIPSNSCIYIHAYHSLEVVEELIANFFINIKSRNSEPSILKDSKVIKESSITYSSHKQEERGYFFSQNYRIPVPMNQWSYNVYENITALLCNEYNGILTSLIKELGMKGCVKVAFKNTVYTPYLTLVLCNTEQSAKELFYQLCSQAMKQVFESIQKMEVENFVKAEIYTNKHVNGLNLAKYIMEAFANGLEIFSYIDESYEINRREFFEELGHALIDDSKISKVQIYPQDIEVDYSNIIKQAIKNGNVNEYVYTKKAIDLSDFRIKKDDKKAVERKLENSFTGEKQIIDNIRYYLYDVKSDSAVVRLYIDITSLSYEDIGYMTLLGRLINYSLYQEGREDIKCYCKMCDKGITKFVIYMKERELEIEKSLIHIIQILEEILKQDIYITFKRNDKYLDK
ncbi:insulinase family protein [Cellulosilyticum ruminicola]|uniref:insulinase family protein n=1 Tax=Cellulosilyticum ruminicola TaxID=425254 RepID=UPI0006D05482|nr:insulinase family protein [Cellulosilyticum ruminicola]